MVGIRKSVEQGRRTGLERFTYNLRMGCSFPFSLFALLFFSCSLRSSSSSPAPQKQLAIMTAGRQSSEPVGASCLDKLKPVQSACFKHTAPVPASKPKPHVDAVKSGLQLVEAMLDAYVEQDMDHLMEGMMGALQEKVGRTQVQMREERNAKLEEIESLTEMLEEQIGGLYSTRESCGKEVGSFKKQLLQLEYRLFQFFRDNDDSPFDDTW